MKIIRVTKRDETLSLIFDCQPICWSDDTWRIKSNAELNRLIANKNIINYIKAQRLAWFGHVHHMLDSSMVKKVCEWSPAVTRSLGRPKNRWEDDVKSDITNMKITNWRDRIRNRPKWKEFVERAKLPWSCSTLRRRRRRINTRKFFLARSLSLHLHKHVFNKHVLECGTMAGYLLHLKSNPFFFRDKSKSREGAPLLLAQCVLSILQCSNKQRTKKMVS